MSNSSSQNPSLVKRSDSALAVSSAITPSVVDAANSPDALDIVGRTRLGQALELEDSPDNRYLRGSLYILGAAMMIFFPWAALTPITQIVQASGEVVPQGDISIIQHLEGGIVSKVNIIDGERVRKGEVLLELRPNLVDSEYRATAQQLQNLLLQQQQLKAAIDGKKSLSSLTTDDNQGSKVKLTQLSLLQSRLTNQADQLSAANAVIAEKRAEVSGLNSQIALYEKQRKMWNSLVGSGAASVLNLLSVDTKLAELKGAKEEALKALDQAQANLRGVSSGLKFEQNSQLAQVVNEEAVVAENIKKLRNQLERTKIVAPVNGIISDLRFKAPGSVVGPGAIVVSVVPDQTPKYVEVRIPAADIGFVKVGQSVDVKLQPFDSTVYGSVSGKLVSIAANTVQDADDRRHYYKARIALKSQYVDATGKRYPIQVGMPLVADIKGRQRSVLRYIFQPFTRTMNSALRESR